ncbi:ATP-dependent helicase [Leptospira ognonensis]|uniref:DNA 3'-5' helicase n=1 Tax=Leptospira ognonensis TaxID=2484945 RepID=A0A4R9JZ12_9LEPT|nr:ATP-dependent helicase [Leptospira ognonensis]TGL57465.1 ATP-dependent helicase [Leptospira ognonensis]
MILVKKGENLNESQKKAAEAGQGPVLVIAGAGTGKTNTLVHRMFHLVQSGVSPEAILLLSFSKRAAAEMLARASFLLDRRMEKVSGGTFHSFGNQFLRKHAMKLGFSSNFSILDTEDATTLIGICREDFLREKQVKRFPKKETLLDIISSSFNTNQSLEKAITREYPQFIRETKEIQAIKEMYELQKFKSNCLDFDDLLHFTRKLLMEDRNVRIQTAEIYKCILVDEYQDTNKIQAHIACLIASEHSNIMVVGDDAQSIYGFRGSDVRNILDFPKIFPETNTITLEENFRSEPEILDLANSILSKFSETYKKQLYSKKEKKGLKPSLYKASSEETEADFIANKIIEENENGSKFKDISVLARSGWHTNLLELELNAKNIPYKKFGGRKFLEQSHVKDIISYLKICVNPVDWLSLTRIALLEEGVGPKQASLLIHNLQRTISLEDFSGDLILHDSFWLGFSKEAKRSLIQLLEYISSLRAKHTNASLQLYESTLSYYTPILKNKYDDHEKRKQDLDTIGILAKDRTSIQDFISYLSLEATESYQIYPDKEKEEEGYVTLSTVHSSKGLEWDIVFVLHLLDGQFPSNRIKTKEDLEEERRLFYVAITRAKSKLFLTAPVVDSQKNIQLRSLTRFITELENLDSLLANDKSIDENSEKIDKMDEKSQKTDRFEQIQTYFLN